MSTSFAIGSRHKALCSDGITRVAQVVNHPDTYFSVPARVKVKGKTVTGAIYYIGYPSTGDERIQFSPDAWRRNAYLLPNWPERCPRCYGRGTILDPSRLHELNGRVPAGDEYDITCPECKGTKEIVKPRQQKDTQ